jgi:hypothetical protein
MHQENAVAVVRRRRAPSVARRLHCVALSSIGVFNALSGTARPLPPPMPLSDRAGKATDSVLALNAE